MDRIFMSRAIELADKGKGFTNPNPLVGAVIVKNGKIIGEGYHQFYGGPHAEINALKHTTEEVTGSTMYVTLEPCCHYGNTPPCTEAIIKNKIAKVVVGMKDPNHLVAGKGIKTLVENGVEVLVGVLEEKVKKQNEIFVKYITTKKPFCILKTAMTLDGKIASTTGDSMWITNKYSRQYVHLLRRQVSSIMVGIGTVLVDNPKLTCRLDKEQCKDPIRIIVDTTCKIPLDSQVLNLTSNAKTIIATTNKASYGKLEALKEKGAEIIITPENDNRIDLKFLVNALGKRGIDSILVEGGSSLNYSVVKEGIVDKVLSFIAPKIIGGENAKTPFGGEGILNMKDALTLHDIKITNFEEDILVEGYLRKE